MISAANVHDFQESDQAVAHAAGLVASTLSSMTGSRITMALSGGSSAANLFDVLAEQSAANVPWERVVICWVDDRFVPPDHSESNYGLARDRLLTKLPIRSDQIYPMPTSSSSPEQGAQDYEQTLRRLFDAPSELPDNGDASCWFPRFDLLLLGMGPDGHIASLFPGKPALEERTRWVTGVPDPGMEPMIPRITLTLPVLEHARHVIALVTGAKKQKAFQEALTDPDSTLPAARFAPQGRISWTTCFRD
ncbi:6-phosphogluconolactonase [Desulfonatronum thiosulfatophilum]|uniref:6-phosphogluconolactonase n=1 Tax=Desulfonatronum thiosulfatophilum TaxID=617002 RepID=A0A1G6EQT8_9BACT|nr:6-phosphogluconolactonase [Desulfonatronum thiosulfatophilum]SDB59793.1 6-phosphogluconolactonase [Desulfonatronum thiosulfatophilum]